MAKLSKKKIYINLLKNNYEIDIYPWICMRKPPERKSKISLKGGIIKTICLRNTWFFYKYNIMSLKIQTIYCKDRFFIDLCLSIKNIILTRLKDYNIFSFFIFFYCYSYLLSNWNRKMSLNIIIINEISYYPKNL